MERRSGCPETARVRRDLRALPVDREHCGDEETGSEGQSDFPKASEHLASRRSTGSKAHGAGFIILRRLSPGHQAVYISSREPGSEGEL